MAKPRQQSSLLDIDESLLHRNLLINKDEEEFQQLLNKAMTIRSGTEARNLPYKTVTPKPGLCIKAKNAATGEKVFINICHTDVIPKPEDVSEEQLASILESDEPSTYRIPMSLGEGHEETDKSGGKCVAYDIAVNTDFLKKVESSELFKTFLVVAAMEGLEDKYNVELDKNGWTVLRNRKHMGTIQSHRIEQREEKPLVREVPKPTQLGKPLIAEVEVKAPENKTARDQIRHVVTLGKNGEGREFLKADFFVRNLVPKNISVSSGEQEIRVVCSNEGIDYGVGFVQKIDPNFARAVCNVSRGTISVLAPLCS